MTVTHLDATEIERRITASLQECGVPQEKIEEVTCKLESQFQFFSDGRPSRLRADSCVWQCRSRLEGVVSRFQRDGLTYNQYLATACDHPQLFFQAPRRIENNVRGLVRRFSRQGLTAKKVLSAAARQPQLLCQSPEAMERKIRGVVTRFAQYGLTTRKYVAAACSQTTLFYQNPDTIENNVVGLVERFAAQGLTMRNYLAAALRQPQLFCQNPAPLEAKVRAVVQRFADQGLTASAYLATACRQPALFYLLPKTVIHHVRWAQWFVHLGIIKIGDKCQARAREAGIDPVIYCMLNKPSYFCLATDNFKLRFYYTRLLQKPAAMLNLSTPRQVIEAELRQTVGSCDLPILKQLYRQQQR